MTTSRGGVKSRQNVLQLPDMFRVYAARVVLLEKRFRSLVAERLYHPAM
ncbi:MAG: hypothetical protein JO336_06160 [Acidobacteriia bacterium]|nr:hypothetical protein [Terriglobia bacterium]MBV8904721.1 hypothetical protein [Terriglobia bacterium]